MNAAMISKLTPSDMGRLALRMRDLEKNNMPEYKNLKETPQGKEVIKLEQERLNLITNLNHLDPEFASKRDNIHKLDEQLGYPSNFGDIKEAAAAFFKVQNELQKSPDDSTKEKLLYERDRILNSELGQEAKINIDRFEGREQNLEKLLESAEDIQALKAEVMSIVHDMEGSIEKLGLNPSRNPSTLDNARDMFPEVSEPLSFPQEEPLSFSHEPSLRTENPPTSRFQRFENSTSVPVEDKIGGNWDRTPKPESITPAIIGNAAYNMRNPNISTEELSRLTQTPAGKKALELEKKLEVLIRADSKENNKEIDKLKEQLQYPPQFNNLKEAATALLEIGKELDTLRTKIKQSDLDRKEVLMNKYLAISRHEPGKTADQHIKEIKQKELEIEKIINNDYFKDEAGKISWKTNNRADFDPKEEITEAEIQQILEKSFTEAKLKHEQLIAGLKNDIKGLIAELGVDSVLKDYRDPMGRIV